MKTFKLENDQKLESGFTVPENYFEDFSARIIQQVTTEPKVITISHRKRTWIYAAAAIVVLAMAIPIYNQFNQSNNVDTITIENYLTANATISDAELISLLEEKDIQEMRIDLNIEDHTIENELSKNKDLEHYLLN